MKYDPDRKYPKTFSLTGRILQDFVETMEEQGITDQNALAEHLLRNGLVRIRSGELVIPMQEVKIIVPPDDNT